MLKKTLESELSILGQMGLEVLFEDMQAQGFRFQEDRFYTMEQLYSFFLMIVGEDGAEVIMKKITRAIDKS